MKINHNIASLSAQRHLFNTNRSIDGALERLSSGLKINTAADDAAGLAIARKMETQNKGLDIAVQNAQDGLALYRIAEGALNNISMMLIRMEELTTRAANSTLTDGDRQNIQDEIDQMIDQIHFISRTTEYNTIKLMDGTLQPKTTTSIVVGSQNTIRLSYVPAATKTGSFSLNVIRTASVAMIVNDAANANSISSTTGVITINGSNIEINAGDSVALIAARINAVNDRTQVMATYDLQTRGLALYSGILDDDARNIAGTAQASSLASTAIGYGLAGSRYKITISGDSTILASLGLTAGTATGTDAIAELDGIRLSADGNHLKMSAPGARSEGLEFDIDIYKGGNGIFIRDGIIGTSAIIHQSAAGDAAVLTVDTTDRMRLHIGANYNQQLYNGLPDIQANKIGIGASSKFGSLEELDVTTVENANLSLKVVQQSIVEITAIRSEIGATMNRLDYTISTLQIQRENLTSAQSRIEDADMAAEMTAFTRDQILLQAGTAMLAQANARPQQVLQLLGG